MTDMREDQITEAVGLIDRGLSEMLHRQLVSTGEVADLLLDVRSLLAVPDLDTSELDEPVAAN